jgi:valyl-tRNA synthetase
LLKSRLQPDADAGSRKVAQQTLGYVLEGVLKLLHPYMPHITEEIWHTLVQQPADSKESIALQPYPEADVTLIDPDLEEQFELLLGTIRTIRNLRAEADVKPAAKVTISLQSDSEKERQILTAGESYIKDLAKVENLTIAAGTPKNQAVASIKKPINWKRLAVTVGGIYLLRLGFQVADTIDNIPIIGEFFAVVGFGYASWFTAKNLLSADARQKFWQQVFKPTSDKIGGALQPTTPTGESEKSIAGVVGTVQVLLSLTGVVDIAASKGKLEKRLTKIEAEINSLKGRLSNAKFVEQAPQDVVQGVRDNLAEAETQSEILRDRLRELG